MAASPNRGATPSCSAAVGRMRSRGARRCAAPRRRWITMHDNEARLALLLARLELDEARRGAALVILEQGVDWRHLLEMCNRHGLAPLVQRHLKALAPKSVPKWAAAALWARTQANARRNRAMAEELAAIVELLGRHGIEAIPYKG